MLAYKVSQKFLHKQQSVLQTVFLLHFRKAVKLCAEKANCPTIILSMELNLPLPVKSPEAQYYKNWQSYIGLMSLC